MSSPAAMQDQQLAESTELCNPAGKGTAGMSSPVDLNFKERTVLNHGNVQHTNHSVASNQDSYANSTSSSSHKSSKKYQSEKKKSLGSKKSNKKTSVSSNHRSGNDRLRKARLFKCPLCMGSFPASDIERHASLCLETNTPVSVPTKEGMVRVKQDSEVRLSGTERDSSENMDGVMAAEGCKKRKKSRRSNSDGLSTARSSSHRRNLAGTDADATISHTKKKRKKEKSKSKRLKSHRDEIGGEAHIEHDNLKQIELHNSQMTNKEVGPSLKHAIGHNVPWTAVSGLSVSVMPGNKAPPPESLPSGVASKERSKADEDNQGDHSGYKASRGEKKLTPDFAEDDNHKTGGLPATSKPDASATEARQFLELLRDTAVKNRTEAVGPKSHGENYGVLEPTLLVLRFLTLVRLVRRNEVSVPIFLTRMKALLPPELLPKFEIFLPTFYTMDNVIPSVLPLSSSAMQQKDNAALTSARTDIQALWERNAGKVTLIRKQKKLENSDQKEIQMLPSYHNKNKAKTNSDLTEIQKDLRNAGKVIVRPTSDGINSLCAQRGNITLSERPHCRAPVPVKMPQVVDAGVPVPRTSTGSAGALEKTSVSNKFPNEMTRAEKEAAKKQQEFSIVSEGKQRMQMIEAKFQMALASQQKYEQTLKNQIHNKTLSLQKNKPTGFSQRNSPSLPVTNEVMKKSTLFHPIPAPVQGASLGNKNIQKISATSTTALPSIVNSTQAQSQAHMPIPATYQQFQLNGTYQLGLLNANSIATNNALLQQQHQRLLQQRYLLQQQQLQQFSMTQNQMPVSQQRMKAPTVITIDDNASATTSSFNNPSNVSQAGSGRLNVKNNSAISSRPTSACSRTSEKGLSSQQLSSGPAFPSFAKHSAALAAAAQMKHIAAMTSKHSEGRGLLHLPSSKSTVATEPAIDIYGKDSKQFNRGSNGNMSAENILKPEVSLESSRTWQPYTAHNANARGVFSSASEINPEEVARRDFNSTLNNGFGENLEAKGLRASTLAAGGQTQWSASTSQSSLMGIAQHHRPQSYPYSPSALASNTTNTSSIAPKPYDGLTKPIKAKNPFTHFCRMIKPAIRAELCNGNANVHGADIKSKIQEETQLRWRALHEEEKQVFVTKSVMDFNRYEREKRIHSEEQQKRLDIGLIAKEDIDCD